LKNQTDFVAAIFFITDRFDIFVFKKHFPIGWLIQCTDQGKKSGLS